jgi:polyferredoxin
MATQLHNEIIATPPPIPGAAEFRKNLPFTKPTAAVPRKKLIRRKDRDYSQRLRRVYQFAFLLMNVWLGGQFYLWVRHYETAGASAYVSRPAGVEGWLPIAGMMNFKYFLLTGRVPELHPAAMFLLVTFVAIAFLFRKAFCSWLCPVGTISEYVGKVGKKIFGRNFQLPRWMDIPLRGLKYGIVADVKMLNFFRFIGSTGLIVFGVLVVASLSVQNFWCRYLCPYGALLGISSVFSPFRILRNVETCIDCSKCAKACPSALPVDKLITIKSAECTGCLECVAVCPAEGALQMALPRLIPAPRRMPTWAFAAGVAVMFFGIVGFAKTAGYWKSDVPQAVYKQLVPHANEASHPMPGDPGMTE